MEKNLQGSVKILDLDNLQTWIEERMGDIENTVRHMEANIEIIVKLIQHQEENIPSENDVGQGTHDDKNSAHLEKPSINKQGLRGFDSNIGSNRGWFTMGIQLPKIDMRKFDGKDPITWIFWMEWFLIYTRCQIYKR